MIPCQSHQIYNKTLLTIAPGLQHFHYFNGLSTIGVPVRGASSTTKLPLRNWKTKLRVIRFYNIRTINTDHSFATTMLCQAITKLY